MISKGIILVTLMFYNYSCISQFVEKKENKSSKNSEYVSFFVDGKKKKIDNRFSFTIIHNKDTIKSRVIGHRLLIPEIADRLDYSVVFKYNKYTLSFDRISKKMLLANQNYTWEFGVDNRPFDESLDLLTSQEYESNKTIRQLQYVRIKPMEYGDGLRFINRIGYNKSK
jgi:hypothetical protein